MTKTALPSLAVLVKDLQDQAETPEWGDEFLDRVMDNISEEDSRLYLREALSRLVYVFDNERRRSTKSTFLCKSDQAQRESPLPPAGPASSFRAPLSTKQELLRTVHWPEFLRSSISTEHGTIMLGLATARDLAQAASKLRGHAAATVRNAEQYERLLKAVEAAGVEKVSDLDMAVVTKAFQGTP